SPHVRRRGDPRQAGDRCPGIRGAERRIFHPITAPRTATANARSFKPPWRLTINELLASIVEAHGGLERRRRFNRIEATIVTGGAFWGMKNLTQDQDPRRMTVWLHEERASVAPFGDPDWHTEFTPDQIAILRGDGSVVAERHDPRTSFAGHEMTTPWDPL